MLAGCVLRKTVTEILPSLCGRKIVEPDTLLVLMAQSDYSDPSLLRGSPVAVHYFAGSADPHIYIFCFFNI